MPRHYIYRIDHDTGYAPRLAGRICFLCGCKNTTVEQWAEKGSWVIGLGGNGTGKPGALIYAMEVDSTPTFEEFSRQYPAETRYLHKWGTTPEAPVLLSRHFYYFGQDAPKLPTALGHLAIRSQGCKRVKDDDILKLQRFLARHYRGPGRPNNPFNFDTGEIDTDPCLIDCSRDSGSLKSGGEGLFTLPGDRKSTRRPTRRASWQAKGEAANPADRADG